MKTFFTTLIIFSLALSSFAQPGILDKSFGDNGIVIEKNVPGYSVKIALQKDGNFIAAGNGTYTNGFLLIRYTPEGNIDSSFGKSGSIITDFHLGRAYCSAVKIQADNKIIAAGAVNDGGYNHIALARYNNDGSLDESFGKSGLVDFNIEFQINAFVTDMVIQPDGKILVTGNSDKGINGSLLPFIVRFNSNGSIDTEFGKQGEVYADFENDIEISSIILQADNKILIGGTYAYLSFPKFMVLRYLSNGIPDSSFGLNGIAKQGFGDGTFAQLNSIAIQKNGSIVCGGYEQIPATEINAALVQFTDNGLIDSSFGNKGELITKLKNESKIISILLQNDGKIIGAGTVNPGKEISSITVIRYMPDGKVDSSFGTNGLTVTAIEDNSASSDAALQTDGKILLAGISFNNSADENHFAFVRYNNDDKNKKQIIISKIRRWLQHRNGIMWDNINGIKNYTVQRSGNGSHWSTVSSQQPIVNRQLSTVNYYNDPAPLTGANYYRLQTTSVDGAINYSNVIAATDDNVSDISIYPNPVKDIIYIKGLDVNMKYKIQITNEAGNLILSAQIKNTASYKFNVKNFNKGLYYISLSLNQDIAITQKFLKE
ncbi:MAG: T9SS type A sorting domain-containing protein [Parafilimonas sp.]